MTKVFGIGLTKTGTTSLAEALRVLGYSCIHYPVSLAQIDAHEAACDIPVTIGFEFLDVMYPGSRFIYTVRDQEEWVDSVIEYFIAHRATSVFSERVRRAVYGAVEPTYDELLESYRHLAIRVETYFTNRTDLLVMDVKYGWEPLCKFLDKGVPQQPFPHLNKRV